MPESDPRQQAERHAKEADKPVVVLIVGIPGAGKTVLIDRAASSSQWTVLDLDRFRRRLPASLRRLPIPYPLFVLAMICAIALRPHVVAESRGTYAWLRRLVTACARIRRREAAIVLLDAPHEDAVAGQERRGRVAPATIMDRYTADWSRLLDAARSGVLAAEGWDEVVVLDRAQASSVDDLGELLRDPSAVERSTGADPAADAPSSAGLAGEQPSSR